MAPVRRTLVATWREEGSSLVAKIGEVDGKSSMGPSSCALVSAVLVGSATWASHGTGLCRVWSGREHRELGLWRKLSEDETESKRKWLWG